MPARPDDAKARKVDLGRRGEDAAASLLVSLGLRVLDRNVRLGRLELDLVCEEGGVLVFVEVKARGAGALGAPADGLTAQKCERLLRAARLYLSQHDLWERPCRFDLVAVWETAEGIRAEHFPDALPLSDAAGWQPW